MRIVVTGATGNIGTSTVSALAGDAAVTEIVGVARRRPAWTPRGVTWVEHDLGDDGAPLEPVLSGADAVIHLAWMIQPSHDQRAQWQTNVVGSRRVFAAAVECGVPAIVHASSVGAYSPGPKDRRVDESWPTDGVPSLDYSWQKSYVERVLDDLEARHPHVRVVRLRPAVVFKQSAASGIRRLFAGPLLPPGVIRPGLSRVAERSPIPFQAVHSLDVGDAFRLAATRPVHGAFNIAAEPVLGRETSASRLVGATLRAAVAAAWHAHLMALPPGWIDLARSAPTMDVTRAREELGWTPRRTADQALAEILEGLQHESDFPTPPLAAETSGPARVREFATGLGER